MALADLQLADLFCGGGGFSTGTARACNKLSRSTSTVAVNHWSIAARTYKMNHPDANVLCTGLDAVLPTHEVPSGRVDLLVASPECTHHANARGGKPMSDQSRSSVWLIMKWLQELYVPNLLIENVQEFVDWGPLGANGRPLPSMKGQLFNQFVSTLKNAYGYNVEYRVVNSANYGARTVRERLMLIARRGKNKRIIWPDATHSKDGDQQGGLFGDKEKWRPAKDIIDWSLPSQSIFGRDKPLAPNTLERIAGGLRKFGGANAEPFLVILRNHMNSRSLNEPMSTITAGGNHIGLCQPQPYLLSMEHTRKALTPFIAKCHHGTEGHRVYDLNDPMPTITTVDGWGMVEPFLITAGGTEGQGRNPRSLNNPMPTILTNDRHAVIEPIIMSYYGTLNVSQVSQPLPTVTTKDRFALVQFGDNLYLDILFRMLQWHELAAAMGFPADYKFAGNRRDKVKQIGNSVEVNTAEAMAMAALAA